MTSPNTPHLSPRRRACCWTLPVLIVLGLLVLAASAWTALHAGRWLVAEDPLEKSSAIVILSGRMPIRAEEAAALYRAGWAPEVWVTHPPGPGAELEAMGISYVGEEFYSARVLMRLGVPADSIHLLEPEAANTVAEMDVISKQLEEHGGSSVILVTTKAHTRRVRTLWRLRANPALRAIVRAAQDDPFDAAHWWRNTGDALDVVREVLGLANARAGLPLRPAK